MSADAWSAIWSSWDFSPEITVCLLIVESIYLRGWLTLRSRAIDRWTRMQLSSFLGGLVVIALALQSPLDVFAAFSLQVHMMQHLLLMIVAPPLILWSAPKLPMLTGLAGPVLDWWGPFARCRWLRRFWRRLFHPLTTWTVFASVLWLWHSPSMYELALRSPTWHRVEHATFLFASILFWWPVVQPDPTRTEVSNWALIPYLFLAGIQGTALAGLITFSDQVLYANYGLMPNLWGWTPLHDQRVAGAVMWIPMSIAFLIPLVWIVGYQMRGSPPRRGRGQTAGFEGKSVARSKLIAQQTGIVERLRGPLSAGEPTLDAVVRRQTKAVDGPRRQGTETRLGKWFKSRAVRRSLKCILLAFALIVVIDGFCGPQVASLNLAGVAPWIHWRGLLVLTLLLGGNFFCMACPLTAFRSLARRLFSPRRRWPRRLRSKWLAVALLLFFFWAYEAYSLWDRPFWTATIITGLFGVTVAMDALFMDAPFCKFLCPIGQFNFVQSLISPAQISVVSASACANCATKDCLLGNSRSRGCELSLFLPKKSGNMDCTFCFECADACPHDNVALLATRPGFDGIVDPSRSSVGRFSRRSDIAVLIVVLLFASLVNAAWMTAPVVSCEEQLAQLTGISRWGIVTLGSLLGLCLAPLTILFVVAWFSDRSDNHSSGWTANLRRFAPALVPLGFGMWLAHFSFHLFTSGDAIWIASARFGSEWMGMHWETMPAICRCANLNFVAWLLPWELLSLDLGLCASLYAVYRIVRAEHVNWIRVASPWCLFLVVFFAACVWVMLQPMQMRGIEMMGM